MPESSAARLPGYAMNYGATGARVLMAGSLGETKHVER